MNVHSVKKILKQYNTFFFICEKVMPLWNNHSMLIYRKTARRIGFNVSNTVIGETPLSNKSELLKFLILCILPV